MSTVENNEETTREDRAPVLVVHQGAELYGSDRMVLESVRGLVEAHGYVIVALPTGGPLVEGLRAVGAEVWRVPTLVLRKALKEPRNWPRLIVEAVVGVIAAGRTLVRIRPDALYVSTETLPVWPVLARCLGIRVVVHVHEAEIDEPVLIRRLLALPMVFADHVVVNSESALAELADALPRAARSAEVILNGIQGPPDGPVPGRADLLEPFRVLYLGRISRRKGVEVAVRAVPRALELGMNVVLDLVGGVFPGYEQFETDMRRFVQEHGLEGRVHFHGFQSDVWECLSAADVVVVPSLVVEAFGNTAVEATMAARPVIVADHTGLLEAVEGCESAQRVTTEGPDAPDAWAQAIMQVRDNWAHYRDAAVRDAVHARRRHDPGLYGRRVAAAVLRSAEGGSVNG
jgi:glycosyltransferase involved in cell wall biosynthesis